MDVRSLNAAKAVAEKWQADAHAQWMASEDKGRRDYWGGRQMVSRQIASGIADLASEVGKRLDPLVEIRKAYQKCKRDEIATLEFFQQVDEILNPEPAKK